MEEEKWQKKEEKRERQEEAAAAKQRYLLRSCFVLGILLSANMTGMMSYNSHNSPTCKIHYHPHFSNQKI